MFWRSATIGGLVLLALGGAACSNGEKTTADSNESKETAAHLEQPPGVAEQEPDDKEAIEIPLSEIWALNMPGTRDVRELEPDAEALKDQLERAKSLPPEEREEQITRLLKRSLIWQIRKALQPGSKRAGPGFALASPEPELLQAVRDVLTGETKRANGFPGGSDITAVFFSRSMQLHVHIYHVERRDNIIEIHCRFVPYQERYVSEHFALIPLGKLPRGIYQVKPVLGPVEQKYLDAGYTQKTLAKAAKFVSQSFKFGVGK